jgi:hypothetical protein
MVVAEAELLLRADHPVRLDSSDGPLPDLEITRENCPRLRHGDVGTFREVPGATDDLLRARPGIHLADPHLVGVRMGCDPRHSSYIDVAPVRLEDLEALHLVPEHGEHPRQLSGVGSGEVDELLQPEKGDSHRNWLRKRRSLSMK